MSDSKPDAPTPRGILGVYGIATGLSALLPLPMVDAYIGELTRGSAMRRVAHRYGVTLTPEARKILSAPGMSDAIKSSRADRWLRVATRRSPSPARAAGGIEDALTALLSAAFLDSYLARYPREAGAMMGTDEATRVRRAMGEAVEGGLRTLAGSTPRSIGQALKDIGSALQRTDDGRTAPERLADALLDSLSNLPEGTLSAFLHRFDEALARDAPALDKDRRGALPEKD